MNAIDSVSLWIETMELFYVNKFQIKEKIERKNQSFEFPLFAKWIKIFAFVFVASC